MIKYFQQPMLLVLLSLFLVQFRKKNTKRGLPCQTFCCLTWVLSAFSSSILAIILSVNDPFSPLVTIPIGFLLLQIVILVRHTPEEFKFFPPQKIPIDFYTLVYRTTHNHRIVHGPICSVPCCLRFVKFCFRCGFCRSIQLSVCME